VSGGGRDRQRAASSERRESAIAKRREGGSRAAFPARADDASCSSAAPSAVRCSRREGLQPLHPGAASDLLLPTPATLELTGHVLQRVLETGHSKSNECAEHWGYRHRCCCYAGDPRSRLMRLVLLLCPSTAPVEPLKGVSFATNTRAGLLPLLARPGRQGSTLESWL
jgi:hypothetical protein